MTASFTALAADWATRDRVRRAALWWLCIGLFTGVAIGRCS